MSITMSHFETLRQRFPDWPAMKAHLESTEGGSLRVVEQGDVAIVRSTQQSNDLQSGVFRSVVWDMSGNTPLCVAPFRSREGMPPAGLQLSATEDFMDGFMMNVWVGADGVLRLATRTRVGGENKFYSEKSFGTLFEECLSTTPLKTVDALRACLAGWGAEEGRVSTFASFVLQHPEHRIVSKFTSPGLYAIHLGYTTATGGVHISERAVNWPQELARLQVPSYPTRMFRSEAEVEDFLRRTAVQRGWRWQGLVFKDGTGSRWRLRTPTYTMLRQLRGGESTSLERFFRLRQERKVIEYLKHYGEERTAFWDFEKTLRARTADILAAYTDVHKAHATTFKELPEAYRPAVFLLHMKWRDELRSKGFSVRLQNAIDVVNQLRSFEKKRLMEAAPYVALAPAAPVEAELPEVVQAEVVESTA